MQSTRLFPNKTRYQRQKNPFFSKVRNGIKSIFFPKLPSLSPDLSPTVDKHICSLPFRNESFGFYRRFT